MDQQYAMQVAAAQELARYFNRGKDDSARPPTRRRWFGWTALAGLFAVLVLTTPRDDASPRHDTSSERVVAEATQPMTRT